ncbi:MAG: S-layer homology domain-containing protein, partial [Lachnospiraceae bacterium]|nr:S-layer homology domain-containing protein [Lachnospiraceae bacterium]
MKKQTKIMMAVLSALFMFAWILSFSFLSVNAEGNVTEIFPDVKEGAWYVKYVQYVYDNGIMAGNKDGTFAPDKPLLREQFSQVLYSIAGKPG